MGAPAKKAAPLWIRANPRQLSADELEELRQGPHLADLKLPKTMFRALIRAGHRWARELTYVPTRTVRDLVPREYFVLYRALADHNISVGTLARERVHFPGGED